MGACIGSCAGSCCASCACAACGKCCDGKTNSRIPYLIVMFIGVCLALMLRYWGKEWVIDLYLVKYDACTNNCLGVAAAYRVSFTLFFFFFFHACFLFAQAGWNVHIGLWLPKICGLLGLLILTFLMPNDVFDIYAYVARFVSGGFLVLQIVILVDFAYSWKENWLADDKDWKKAFLAASALMYAVSIIIWVFSFRWFTDGDCKLETFFVAFTIVLCVLFTLISLTSWCEHGNLLTSAVVTLYCTYLCWSALQSDPSSCNSLNSSNTANVVIGLAIGATTVTYAGWNLSNSKSLFGNNSDDEEHSGEDAFIATGPNQNEKVKRNKADSDPEDGSAVANAPDPTSEEAIEKRARARKFHFVMAAAAMYLAMVTTGWGSESSSSSSSYDMGTVTLWIKIGSLWVTVLLYTWTLIAPYVLKNRDFS